MDCSVVSCENWQLYFQNWNAQLERLCAWPGASRPLTLRLPLDQQAVPQQEMVVVRCSLSWVLLMLLPEPFDPTGPAGAPAAE